MPVLWAPGTTPRAAADLARGCDVITLEIEQISIASLEAAGRHAPVRPGKEILAMVQDRIRQKNWLRDQGFPVGAYRAIYSEEDLLQAVAELGPGFISSGPTAVTTAGAR